MKKICIMTATRAEYGLLKPIMKLIQKDEQLSLKLIVSGAHLCEEFGNTYQDIEKDGFLIDCNVDLDLADDTVIGISHSMAIAINGFAIALNRIKPDIIVLLGDRYETLMMAVAATVAKVPIAHLYGGETTEGAYDEAFRHCITKMSQLHFTSTDTYRSRVIQMGEHPDRVFNVGAIGVENINKLPLLSLVELRKELNFEVDEKTILLTFHPVTLDVCTSETQFKILLDALDDLKRVKIIFTYANADTDGKSINRLIDEYVARNSDRSIAFFSMGQLRYLSTMQYVGAVVGNSSSGIIEAPTFKVPTINIGDRQKGRIQANSVINCPPDKGEIKCAVELAFSKSFKESIKNTINPYGNEKTSEQIAETLKDFLLNDRMNLKKSFYDLGVEY